MYYIQVRFDYRVLICKDPYIKLILIDFEFEIKNMTIPV